MSLRQGSREVNIDYNQSKRTKLPNIATVANQLEYSIYPTQPNNQPTNQPTNTNQPTPNPNPFKHHLLSRLARKAQAQIFFSRQRAKLGKRQPPGENGAPTKLRFGQFQLTTEAFSPSTGPQNRFFGGFPKPGRAKSCLFKGQMFVQTYPK